MARNSTSEFRVSWMKALLRAAKAFRKAEHRSDRDDMNKALDRLGEAVDNIEAIDARERRENTLAATRAAAKRGAKPKFRLVREYPGE